MERLGASLEVYWGVLKASLEGPGASWGVLEASWGRLGVSWRLLGASCRFSNDRKPSWRRREGVFEALGVVLQASGRRFGTLLDCFSSL